MDQLTRTVIDLIDERMHSRSHLLVAIDGRCASGKTSLAGKLQRHYGCNVIHMDHFFLRPEQRTQERLNTPGENVDHERFLEEVLMPLKRGEGFSYCPFDCSVQTLSEPVTIIPGALTIIEGSYSCHLTLRDHYDLRIFLTVGSKEQMCRITERNGEEKAKMFQNRWIPLEERYFSAFEVAERCDYRFDTSVEAK